MYNAIHNNPFVLGLIPVNRLRRCIFIYLIMYYFIILLKVIQYAVFDVKFLVPARFDERIFMLFFYKIDPMSGLGK